MDTLVKPKNELAKRIKICKIVAKIIEELSKLPQEDLKDMKNNPELIKYVCNLVENLISKKYKPNKKEIVLDILKRVIPGFSTNDEKLISDIIEFLHQNKDIKKIRWVKLLGKYSIIALKWFIAK
jgi:exopolyphosphatase/pppGpp-phosphohydrolase